MNNQEFLEYVRQRLRNIEREELKKRLKGNYYDKRLNKEEK